MDWRRQIHADPNILWGKPVVKGTRLSVEFILGLFAAGWNERQVLDNYPTLTPEALRAVFAFAAGVSAVDREGRPLLVAPDGSRDGRVGGTPVLSMNGNTWIGTGHNSLLTDYNGQDWFVYHAVNRFDPVFDPAAAGTTDYNKRAPLIDPLDWVAEWPTVRGGLGPSESHKVGDTVVLKPAAQPGAATIYAPEQAKMDVPGAAIETVDFDGSFDGSLGSGWSWVRPPAEGAVGLEPDGSLRFDLQGGDLYKERNDASVLVRPAPTGDYLVETKVRVDVPTAGHSYNYAQAGLVIYFNDDHYTLVSANSGWE